jgi:hypothetical protein
VQTVIGVADTSVTEWEGGAVATHADDGAKTGELSFVTDGVPQCQSWHILILKLEAGGSDATDGVQFGLRSAAQAACGVTVCGGGRGIPWGCWTQACVIQGKDLLSSHCRQGRDVPAPQGSARRAPTRKLRTTAPTTPEQVEWRKLLQRIAL